MGNYGLPTCKDGSKFSMREVHNLIDCPLPCIKYSIQSRSESGVFDLASGSFEQTFEFFFNDLVQVSYDQYSYIWLNLVAEVGGYVGLFLGFSVFQLTDLMDVLLQRNWIESLKSILIRFKISKD